MNIVRFDKVRCLWVYVGILLLFLHADGMQGQPIVDSDQNAKRHSAIIKWAEGISSFDSTRPTIVITTSAEQCRACGAAAINAFALRIKEDSIAANLMVIIAVDDPREARPLKTLLKSVPIALGLDKELWNDLFHPSLAVPDAYAVSPDGAILGVFKNFQTNPPTSIELASKLALSDPGGNNSSLINLHEDDDHILIEVVSPILSLNRGRITFIERRRNAIETYDLRTGDRLSSFSASTDLGTFFRKKSDDSSYWDRTVSVYSPLVDFQTLIDGPLSDTAHAVGVFLRSYDTSRAPSGKLQVNWRRGEALFDVSDQNWSHVLALSIKRYVPEFPYVSIDGRIFTCPVWVEYEPADQAQPHDSLVALAVIDTISRAIVPLVTRKQIEDIYGVQQDAMYNPHICDGGNGSIIYLDPVNRAFLRISLNDKANLLQPIQPGGTVREGFANYPHDTAGIIDIPAVMASRDRIFTVVVDRRHAPIVHVLVAEYRISGEFIGEHELYSQSGVLEQLMVPSGTAPDFVMLMKWKGGQWQIKQGHF